MDSEPKKQKKKTRSNGEGTIYFNGRYWVAQVTIGRDAQTGKLKRKSFYGNTQKEVKERLVRVQFELSNEVFVDPSNMLVKDWATYWLENFKKPELSETTLYKYTGMVNRHIIKPLGFIPLKSLTVFQIQSTLNEMQKNGLSDDYINMAYTRLNAMLNKAVDTELLKKNPCSGVVVPKSGKKKAITALTKEEQVKLVEVCQDKKNGDLFIFLLGTGVRIGEALALTWDKVNFDNGQITISQTTSEMGAKTKIYDKTKTPAGVRILYMSDKIKELLKAIQSDQDKGRNTLNLVFPSSAYTICLTTNIRIRLDLFCDEAEIRKINIHALRHTFATRALEQGVNIKVISKMLGHKDIKVTLNTYSHILSEFEKDNFAKIDIFL